LKKYHSLFRFKQFDVYQDEAAMKVGTDGVLLGAWSQFSPAQTILDVGTGTGLIALMAAQKNKNAQIFAVELDATAARQAGYNFDISPWKERLHIIEEDFKTFAPEILFDVIVSNPPFFTETIPATGAKRNIARHTIHLNLQDLIYKSALLLKPTGKLFMILPFDKESELLSIAQKAGLFITKMTYVKGHKQAKIKRILVTLQAYFEPLQTEELIIEITRHKYTTKYINLTRDFYLKM